MDTQKLMNLVGIYIVGEIHKMTTMNDVVKLFGVDDTILSKEEKQIKLYLNKN
jgi:hypothetical protein